MRSTASVGTDLTQIDSTFARSHFSEVMAMKKLLVALLVMSALGAAVVGCHAEGGVDPNSAASVAPAR
jgi:hypothetical protein